MIMKRMLIALPTVCVQARGVRILQCDDVRLAVASGLALRLSGIVAAQFELMQVLAGDISGYILAREARGIKLRYVGVAMSNRANQPVKVLVDQSIGSDQRFDFFDGPAIGNQPRTRPGISIP